MRTWLSWPKTRGNPTRWAIWGQTERDVLVPKLICDLSTGHTKYRLPCGILDILTAAFALWGSLKLSWTQQQEMRSSIRPRRKWSFLVPPLFTPSRVGGEIVVQAEAGCLLRGLRCPLDKSCLQQVGQLGLTAGMSSCPHLQAYKRFHVGGCAACANSLYASRLLNGHSSHTGSCNGHVAPGSPCGLVCHLAC